MHPLVVGIESLDLVAKLKHPPNMVVDSFHLMGLGDKFQLLETASDALVSYVGLIYEDLPSLLVGL